MQSLIQSIGQLCVALFFILRWLTFARLRRKHALRGKLGQVIEQIGPVVEASDVLALQDAVKQIYVDDLVKQYIVSLVEATRHHPSIYLGASPRGSLALFRASQARALLQGRDYVTPDDVKALAEPALAHRTLLSSSGQSQGRNGRVPIAEILETVTVPGAIPGR